MPFVKNFPELLKLLNSIHKKKTQNVLKSNLPESLKNVFINRKKLKILQNSIKKINHNSNMSDEKNDNLENLFSLLYKKTNNFEFIEIFLSSRAEILNLFLKSEKIFFASIFTFDFFYEKENTNKKTIFKEICNLNIEKLEILSKNPFSYDGIYCVFRQNKKDFFINKFLQAEIQDFKKILNENIENNKKNIENDIPSKVFYFVSLTVMIGASFAFLSKNFKDLWNPDSIHEKS